MPRLGTNSSDSYTDTTRSGTVTTISSNFTQSTTDTLSFGITGFSAGITFGASSSSGNSNAFTETISDASSVANFTNTSGPNTVSHSQDLFVLWMNPEVEQSISSFGESTYDLSTQTVNGVSQPVDIIEVTAKVLQADSSGNTEVPTSLLGPQYDSANGSYDLPGLANLCKNTQYPACQQGTQCGCVPSDFSAILASDPLVNLSTTADPTALNTSPSSACESPNSSASCRYVPELGTHSRRPTPRNLR